MERCAGVGVSEHTGKGRRDIGNLRQGEGIEKDHLIEFLQRREEQALQKAKRNHREGNFKLESYYCGVSDAYKRMIEYLKAGENATVKMR